MIRDENDNIVIKAKSSVLRKYKSKQKRGPGRPRKSPIQEPKKKLGIQQNPQYDTDNIMELVYCYPLIIKKIFGFFIGHSETVHCKFKKTRIDMMCQDKFGANRIRITINGDDMHRYYCRDPMEFGLSLSYLEPLHKKLRKQFNELRWFSEEDEKAQKTHIWLKWDYYDDVWNRTGYSLAGTYIKVDEDRFDNYDEKDYPISFTLKHKIFKDIIDDASHHGDNIYIRQFGRNSPLCIEYQPELCRFDSSNSFKDPHEIKLISRLRIDEIFSVAIRIEYLKPIASTIPSEEVKFMVSKTSPLIMTSYLDNKSIVVRVLTDIITEK